MLVKDVVNDLATGRRSVEEAVDQLLERRGGVSKAISSTLMDIGKAAADKVGGIVPKTMRLYSKDRAHKQIGKAILAATAVAAASGMVGHHMGKTGEQYNQLERRLATTRR